MKNKKKLTIVSISGIYDFVGGAETFNSELCSGLEKKGHVVVNLYATPDKKNASNLPSSKNFFYELGKLNIFDLNIKGIFTLFFELKKIVKIFNPDILYLHLFLPPLTVAIFSKYFKIPKIVHTYGVWYSEFESSNINMSVIKNNWIKFKYKLGLIARKIFQKLMLIRADGIVTLSDFHKNQVINKLGINPDKIEIISGGVNNKIFYPSSKSRSQLKREMGFSNKHLITIVSRIEPRKGIVEAIKAMSIVNKKTDATLLIISPHYDCTFLHYLSNCYDAVTKNQLGGKVLFKTGLTKEQLRPYYQMSDCFFMSSISLETFGLTMVEAMMSGAVVIGANSGNVTELLRKVDPKLLANKPSPQLFANKILEFLKLPNSKKKDLSLKSIEVAKTFNWKIKVDELENYFYQFLS